LGDWWKWPSHHINIYTIENKNISKIYACPIPFYMAPPLSNHENALLRLRAEKARGELLNERAQKVHDGCTR